MRWLLALAGAAALATEGALAAEPSASRQDNASLEALELQMAELVNRDRAEHRLPPLAYHKGLAAVARAHCVDMKRNRFFDHDSPRTGGPKDRVGAARIPHRGVAENIAAAATIEIAEKNLMHSPKHRENILHKDFTHIGVGLLRTDDGGLLCTQVFIKAPPDYDIAALHTELIEGINKARLAKGLRRLMPDDTLAEQAYAHSARAAKLGRFDPMWLEDELARRDARRWRMHTAGYYLTDSVTPVIQSEVAQSGSFDHIGVGVVQAPPDSKQPGALWVTIVCAQKK